MVHEILMAEMVLSTRDLQITFSTGWCLDMSHYLAGHIANTSHNISAELHSWVITESFLMMDTWPSLWLPCPLSRWESMPVTQQTKHRLIAVLPAVVYHDVVEWCLYRLQVCCNMIINIIYFYRSINGTVHILIYEFCISVMASIITYSSSIISDSSVKSITFSRPSITAQN